jgi:hypothetical protein
LAGYRRQKSYEQKIIRAKSIVEVFFNEQSNGNRGNKKSLPKISLNNVMKLQGHRNVLVIRVNGYCVKGCKIVYWKDHIVKYCGKSTYIVELTDKTS